MHAHYLWHACKRTQAGRRTRSTRIRAMEAFNRVHMACLLSVSRKLMRKDREDVRIELTCIVEAARVERPGRLQRPAAIRKLLVDVASRYCAISIARRLQSTHGTRAK